MGLNPPIHSHTLCLEKVTQISNQIFYLLLMYSGEMAFTQHRLYNEMCVQRKKRYRAWVLPIGSFDDQCCFSQCK